MNYTFTQSKQMLQNKCGRTMCNTAIKLDVPYST